MPISPLRAAIGATACHSGVTAIRSTRLPQASHCSSCGSFNLSRSGERNAENVLEIEDATLADQVAAYVDAVRSKYGPVKLPPA